MSLDEFDLFLTYFYLFSNKCVIQIKFFRIFLMTIEMYVPQLVVSHCYDNIYHRNWDMTAGLILDAAVAIMDFVVGISTATTKSVQRKVCTRWSCPQGGGRTKMPHRSS